MMEAQRNKTILIIDDEANMRHMLHALLKRHGYLVNEAENGQQALAMLADTAYSSILCDVRMPDMDGLQFLSKARIKLQGATVIMMSAYGSVDMALQAIQLGAYDFIAKPFKADEVIMTLAKAEEREALRQENQVLRDRIAAMTPPAGFADLIGESQAMRQLIQMAAKIARYNSSVLISGESGTGKELVAQGIHLASPRQKERIISINCASIPENLLESEFFGYVKGAFTGADRDRRGIFEEAHGGSLFLDEIAELPTGLQGKLLRVLQENEVLPLGARQTRKVDVRIIAATSRDLEKLIRSGDFREDLYYRLNVVNLQIPPLRQRKEDIPSLCCHFLKKINRQLGTAVELISAPAMTQLLAYEWPGNVRELENIIQRCIVMAEGKTIQEIPFSAQKSAPPSDGVLIATGNSLSLKLAHKNLEEQLIRQALDRTGGNRSKAAVLLELSYPSLLAKIKSYKLEE